MVWFPAGMATGMGRDTNTWRGVIIYSALLKKNFKEYWGKNSGVESASKMNYRNDDHCYTAYSR